MKFLKNHPFAVEAFFDSSLVLTFAVPKDQLQHMIPGCLELDTLHDQWAFLAVAMVQTRGLRPKGFPKLLGNDFFLIGYRIFVRYTSREGKRLRGLYIIRSETDKRKMAFFGNLFTHYNYSATDISLTHDGQLKTIASVQSKFRIVVDPSAEEPPLPEGSPFTDWKEARKFAGPLPFTFTYNDTDQSVLIIEGVRQNWNPVPVSIQTYQIEFLNQLKLKNPVLANAFEVRNLPYYWKKGRIEKWR